MRSSRNDGYALSESDKAHCKKTGIEGFGACFNEECRAPMLLMLYFDGKDQYFELECEAGHKYDPDIIRYTST